jgi:hypothetical protein
MEVNYVCSLGSFCFPANYMRTHNLQKCSYPFDYILTGPEVITDCLKDDFKLFLDKSRHERLVNEGNRISSNHKLYGKFSNGKNFIGLKVLNETFKHHDITDDDIYASFERKIERFRILLKKDEPKLFLLFAQDEEYDRRRVDELNRVLKEKTSNFQILCISMFNDFNFRYEVEDIDNIKYIKTYTYGRNLGDKINCEVENELFHQMIQKYYVFNVKDDIKVEKGVAS